jgi:hypothetical protein
MGDSATTNVVLGGLGEGRGRLGDCRSLWRHGGETGGAVRGGPLQPGQRHIYTREKPVLTPVQLPTSPFGTAILLLRSAPPIALRMTARPDRFDVQRPETGKQRIKATPSRRRQKGGRHDRRTAIRQGNAGASSRRSSVSNCGASTAGLETRASSGTKRLYLMMSPQRGLRLLGRRTATRPARTRSVAFCSSLHVSPHWPSLLEHVRSGWEEVR